INIQLSFKELHNKRFNTSIPLTFSIEDIDMLTKPSTDSIIISLSKLYTLGFLKISPENYITLSPAGQAISQCVSHSVSIESFRMILAAFSWQVNPLFLVNIAAYLTISPSAFVINNNKPITNLTKDQAFLRFIEDDFLIGLFIYEKIKSIIHSHITSQPDSLYPIMNELKAWSKSANIKFDQLLTFISARNELMDSLLNAQINIYLNFPNQEFSPNLLVKLKYCIWDGYHNNLLIKKSNPPFYHTTTKHPIHIKTRPQPKYILYDKLVQSTQNDEYIITPERCCVLDGFINLDPNL
ncbi:MAG: hypothetical protein ACYCPT_13910, partial [Acidimicrobiales bacterium]